MSEGKSARFFEVLNACMSFWYIPYLPDLSHTCFLSYPVKFSGERGPQVVEVPLGVQETAGCGTQCPGLVDKVVMAQKMHLMTLQVFSILNDSVIIFFLCSLHLFAILIFSDHKNTRVPLSVSML